MKRGYSYVALCAILLALLGFLAMPAANAAKPQDFANVCGVYGLLPVECDLSDNRITDFLGHSQFYGVSLRVKWSTVEPTENNYSWDYIDSIISMANGYNKKVTIRLMTGHNTPGWVYTAGAEEFQYFEDDTGQNERIPVPWDAVYHAKLQDMISDLGARYNSNSTVTIVHVSGPSRSSAEMLLPKSAADKTNWTNIGYTPQKLIDAWTDVLGYYATSLPNKVWSLNLHVPIWDDGVPEAVANYVSAQYPWQCGVQINYWSEFNSDTHAPIVAMCSAADEFTFGGLQPSGIFPSRAGDINIAIDKALAWHTVAWSEMYHPNRDDVTELYNETTKYKAMLSSATFNAADGQNGQSALTWTNPSGYSGFQQVKILRKTGSYPNGPNDSSATVVYQGTSQSHTNSGLTNGTTYYYSMYELPSNYTIGQDTATPSGGGDTTAPGNVTSFTATPGDQQIQLAWTNPTDSDLAGIKIQRSTTGYPSTPTSGTNVYDQFGTSWIDSGLTNGVQYYYSAFAYDEVPNYASGSGAGATPASGGGGGQATFYPTDDTYTTSQSPTETRGTATELFLDGDGNVRESFLMFNVSGVGSVTNATLRIYCTDAGSNTKAYAISDTSWDELTLTYDTRPTMGALLSTDSSVTVGAWTELNVTSHITGNGTFAIGLGTDDTGQIKFEAKEGTNHPQLVVTYGGGDTTPPNAVSGFNATPGDGQVSLSWTNPTDSDLAGVLVQRKTGGYPTSPTDGTNVYNGSGTSKIDTGLTNGTTYYYAAYAYDEVPNHSNPALDSVVPADTAAPAPVTSFNATAGDMQVGLSWTNPTAADFANVRIQRKTGSYPTGPTDGANVYTGTGTSANDTGVVNGTTYYYAAYACDEVPNYSTAAQDTAVPADAGAPAPVTNLTATPGNTQVTLNWTNPTSLDFAGVRVQRKTGAYPTSPTDGTNIYSGPDPTTTDIGLTNGTTYYYKAYAFDEVPNYSTGAQATAIPQGAVTLLDDGFEANNFNLWTDGGATDWNLADTIKHVGLYSANAADTDNDLISDNLNASGKSSMTIEFWYRDDDIDADDNIFFQLYDGAACDDKFELDTASGSEDSWQFYTVTINNSGADAQYFHSNFRIKFEATSLDSGERLWIDDVKVTGQ